jgi:hypothetical protein
VTSQNSIWVLLVAEQAQLILLKDELNKIRKDKRNIAILGTIISIIYWIIIEQYWKDFLTATITFLMVGVILYLTVIKHYNAKEAQIIWQIKRFTKKSASEDKL